MTIHAQIDGYESPAVDWQINGQSLPILQGTIEVDVSWEPEPRNTFVNRGASIKLPYARIETTKLSNSARQITLAVGPGAGNASIRVSAVVREEFDVPTAGGKGSTQRTAFLLIDLKNQEIVWGREFIDAKKNCARIQHLFAGPAVDLGPPRVGDPEGLVERVSGLVREQTTQRRIGLLDLADALHSSRPELSAALTAAARRTK